MAAGSPKASERIEVRRITRDLPKRFWLDSVEEKGKAKENVRNGRVAAVKKYEFKGDPGS